jgi:hypothetical protein
MTTYSNAGRLAAVVAASAANSLTVNRFDFNLAGGERPTTKVAGDRIKIGVVPPLEKLVPHLCLLIIPQLDSNGAPTGDYSVGSEDDADALKASAPAETAVTLSGEDFILTGTGDIGAEAEEVGIYITLDNTLATLALTGVIKFVQVTRPYDTTYDSDVT